MTCACFGNEHFVFMLVVHNIQLYFISIVANKCLHCTLWVRMHCKQNMCNDMGTKCFKEDTSAVSQGVSLTLPLADYFMKAC